MIYTIRQRIQEVFGHYDRHVPADVIKGLFVVIPNDETTLTQEIMGYLLEHNYEALKTPQGQSLRERLMSTDWRQKDEKTQQEEKQWVSEPLPLSTDVSVHPVPIPFSQSNKVLITLVILFVTILLWLWKGKLSEIDNGSGRVEASEMAPTPAHEVVLPKETTNTSPSAGTRQRKGAVLPVAEAPVNQNSDAVVPTAPRAKHTVESPVAASAGDVQPEQTKPYDVVDNRVGDFGLRAAQKGSKWGYVNQKDQWQIDPIYDDVMPFQNGKANVLLDGQQISIDRDGVRIRED